MRAVLAALLAAPLLLAALPVAANHVPPGATVIELPPLAGEERQWMCLAGLFWEQRFQVGQSCEFWCITDGGCAVFYKDFNYLADFPFEVEFVNAQQELVRRSSADFEGHVCMFWWEMLDLHFTFLPRPVAPGTVGHAFAVKDEGQFCPW